MKRHRLMIDFRNKDALDRFVLVMQSVGMLDEDAVIRPVDALDQQKRMDEYIVRREGE